jgi:hypothetical protein
MNCNHIVLQFHHNNELLTISNFISKLSCHVEDVNIIYKSHPLFEKDGLEKPMTVMKYLDQRRGYTTLFNFCPTCGEKINWKQIKKNLG